MKKTFAIHGMHCASCATIISSKLTKKDGVHGCEVNFGTKNALIDFDESLVREQDLAEEVARYGYQMVVPQAKNDDGPSCGDSVELEQAWSRLLVALPLTLVALVAMTYMIGIDYAWWTKNLFLHHLFMGLLPLMAVVMLTVVGWKYIVALGRYFRYGVANMDTLVGIGTITAFIYSFVAKTFGDLWPDILGKQYFFEAVIVVIGFIELGKYLEMKVMSKTGRAIQALLGLQAKEALIDKEGKEVIVPLQQVVVGDIMIVKPGEKIPLDGKIVSGSASIDESMITGESLPVSKQHDDIVMGSTIVINSTIRVEATAVGEETYLSKIIAIVQAAQNSKPQIQKLADTIMQYFVPVVLLIAVLAGGFWLLFGNQFYPDINTAQFALMSFVGVLVIACPCGLGLATPMAIITGVGHGAKNGILAKNAEGLLKLRKSTIVVFDKTGTITEGKPKLVEQTVVSHQEDHLRILASLESLSSHPIAHAIVSYAKEQGISLSSVDEFQNIEGVGVSGMVDGIAYVVCKPSYATDKGFAVDNKIVSSWTSQGKTPLLLMTTSAIIGYYAVADEIKQTSKDAIDTLKTMGITPIMLTGDHTNTAWYIAQRVGIDRVYAEVKPEEKASIIQELQRSGVVTMVGDGINDAPALATADVGVAMSTGTDVAIESAELTLLHGDLSKLVKAIKISKLTHHAIIQNLVRAFGFNLVGIPLAAGVFYPLLGILLNPAFEGAAMAFSSLMVMGNSLRLQAKKI